MRGRVIRLWGKFWAILGKNRLWRPIKTGKIAENLYALHDKDVNLFIYSDGDNTVCIDAGYRNNAYLKVDFNQLEVDPDVITHLFLTHTDLDHAGGVEDSSKTSWFTQAKLYLGRNEEQMIDGTTYRAIKLRLFKFYNPVTISRDYTLLTDGEVITVGRIKVQAIPTPGHTPGHMAYVINDTLLFTGDALTLKNGQVQPFYHGWNMNNELAEDSVKKLAALENISVLCTAHTGYSQDYKTVMSHWRE